MRKFLKNRVTLAISLVLLVLAILLVSMIVTGACSLLLRKAGYLTFDHIGREATAPGPDTHFPLGILFVLGFCTIFGTVLTALFSGKALNPIRKIIWGINEVAKGNFDTKVNIKGIGELEELSDSFNRMTQELSGIETLRTDFINNFSHEFKTPIVSIQGFARLLRDGNLSPAEQTEYLDIILEESDRLAALSTNVLTLSRYETLEIVSEKVLFPLDEQVRRVILLLEPKWSNRNISIDPSLEAITFFGNKDLTEQIWINLIDNAIKFSHANSAIDIRLSSSPDMVEFVIRDEGSGMNADTQAQIFEKFYQGDASRGAHGNGLGLSIVKRIVTLCCGTIDVISKPEEGSTFTVRLPNTKP